jgi:hypothetical protein
MSETQPKKNFLVIEDTPIVLTAYMVWLDLLDISGLGAASVDEARSALMKGEITDIVTDGLNGGWRTILDLASENGIESDRVTVVTADPHIEGDVVNTGANYVNKSAVVSGRIQFEDLFK